ncbi:thioesterase family protein [Cupriavidus plantarum]|uniref:Thioesterase superfamily protein n=1 Tax=Cupriavidus plantarum TaxID=942865 RepID=A0A316EJP1_9BURK|nr:LysR family transcriptional regulator [Cupriavidus plantarum]NYI01395.1 putative thioesterase [Cupriavidus plantarum]PWK32618.1 thioesterase superfamily protein [Cupriavidus plantarum]REE90715.1 thioesterase superfamily protein [Cupriavidus plantarum]CAG2151725.1 Fluoroacetyl-CoA thioesterase [Cupriavidus plantarum]SMR85102.1 Thioesterase superfamily [Cupriavidus plantarum]
MDAIKTGTVFSRALTVDRARTIDFLGESLRIYATPELVRDIEETCLAQLQTFLGEGESSVGTEVSIAHTGATPLGGDVRIDAEITAVDGRSVTFRVSAADSVETICTGTHKRFVVDIAKLAARVQKKTDAVRAAA